MKMKTNRKTNFVSNLIMLRENNKINLNVPIIYDNNFVDFFLKQTKCETK